MSADDREAIGARPQVSGPAPPTPVGFTFQLREQVNRQAISRVNYKLRGPGGLQTEADGAEVPVTLSVQRPGKYVVLFQKPGFFPKDVVFHVASNTRDQLFDVDLRRAGGGVRVEVRDRASNQPMTGFKVRVVYRGKQATKWVGPIQETHYDALLDLESEAVLQVEAPGYTPSEEKVVKVSALEPETEVVFFLDRAMAFTGIELRVFEASLRPAKSVRVVAEIKQPDNTWREMWNRRASRENGVYQLPDLKAGIYRLTLRAVPPEGQLDMHVPFVKEVEFTGGEKYEVFVQLVAGARLLLKVTDAEGKVLGQDVSVRLTTAAGEVVRSLWEHIDDQAKPLPFVALGANGLVQDGRARLFDPVPPGQYRLQVQRGGRESQAVPLTLEAGATRTVRVKL